MMQIFSLVCADKGRLKQSLIARPKKAIPENDARAVFAFECCLVIPSGRLLMTQYTHDVKGFGGH